MVKKYPTVNCTRFTPNLVYLSGDLLKVRLPSSTRWLKRLQLFKQCRYSARVRNADRDGDRSTKTVYTSPYFDDVIQLNETDDYVVVECYDKFNHVISRSYIHRIRKKLATEAELRVSYEKHVGVHAPRETLSVMMVGIDGMSKQNLQRSMPKTRNFLLGPLKAIELHKYNKIGLNTFPNVVGLLMGKHEHEMNFSYSQPFDSLNDEFIWSEYRRAGYRTALTFDMTGITAFHYLKLGWKKSPVDYYFREMVIDSEPDTLMRNQYQRCLGEVPEVDVLNDYFIQLASIFNNSKTEPYFAYSFAARLTHDDLNQASAGDELYYNFFNTLAEREVLNNTVLVFFSDHGERFGAIRSTYNGMIEGRTPHLLLVFPPWFHAKYPHLMDVLRINQQRLTSHFDVHATLRDLLYFKGETGPGNITHRGISLFREIPRLRTCRHMGVSEENCVCNHLSPHAKVDPNLAQFLAMTLVNRVMDYTNQYRKNCSALTLKSIETVMTISTPENSNERYQLTITTEPGSALYEGVVEMTQLKKADVIGDVTRLNMYKGQAECIQNAFLRQFCYCHSES
ncbi:unnamed protein product [Lymnaea stagnalis]|uniref:Uncharacterized protein n=1 Tax=Lymnaea stagnalis TaxID=6523 RepID=A0AAV2ILP9_LYMST